MLTESAARWLLVLHTAVGVAAVGAATHLVIWLRHYVRGAAGRRRSVVRFAWLVLGLQLSAFLIGNVMYPTYKVEVRAAYLENGAAVAADLAARDRDVSRLADREHARAIEAPATAAIVRRAAQAARWFDVKEHWIALGMMCAAALVLILTLWQPSRDGPVLAPIALGLAVMVAATSWLGAIIGVMTAAWRAV